MEKLIKDPGIKVVVFDTETTDMISNPNARIIQIAVLAHMKSGDDVFIETSQTMCNPNVEVSIDAMSVHHITNEDLAPYGPFYETETYTHLCGLNEEKNVFVAHNALFDIEFLKRENIILRTGLIDTLKVARHLYPDLKKHNLQYLRYYFGLNKLEKAFIEENNLREISAHDALGDVIVTYLLLVHFTKEGHSIKDLINLSNVPIVPKIMCMGKYKGQDLVLTVKSDPDYYRWCLQNMDKLSSEYKDAIKQLLGVK